QFDFSKLTPITECKVCNKGQVYSLPMQYVCENAVSEKPSCKFKMGRTILQREIPAEQVVKLMQTGKTDLLPRFISKKGRPFSAFLKLDASGKVGFEFAPRVAKPKKVAKAKEKSAEPA